MYVTPIPDEEETSIFMTHLKQLTKRVKRSVKKAIEWLAVIVGALLVAFFDKNILNAGILHTLIIHDTCATGRR